MKENPVDATRAPKQRPRHVEAFTLAELDALFAQAEGTRPGRLQWRGAPLLRFLAFSGLRRGEALGLTWADVAPGLATLVVRRARVRVKGGSALQETDAGMRTIGLPEPGKQALQAQKRLQLDDRKRALRAGDPGRWQDTGAVFTTANGLPLDPARVTRDFMAIRKAAGVRPLPLPALRHAAVSLMLAAGVDLPTVSKVLGHKRYAITVDTYGHLTPEGAAAAAEAVDAFLSRSRDKQAAAGKGGRRPARRSPK